jgi:hypothetical protein
MGYIITTSRQGGLRVTDLYRNEVLWSLSSVRWHPYTWKPIRLMCAQDYVCELAHCEYGGGYIIFNRLGNFKEVWRRACDFDNTTLPTESFPDALQLEASANAAEQYHSDTLRGHFRPWGLIALPTFGRAFRFVWPNLVVAAEDQAFVWDIPSMRHAITIYDTQAPVDGAILGRINYVEMNERYVILCGSQQLRIFSRSPQGALLYHIPASKTTYAKSALDLPDDYEHGTGDMVLTPRATSARFNDLTAAPETLPPAMVDVMRFDDFVAGVSRKVLHLSFSDYCDSPHYSVWICLCCVIEFWKSPHCQ